MKRGLACLMLAFLVLLGVSSPTLADAATLTYLVNGSMEEKELPYSLAGELIADMVTTKGTVRIRLWKDVAPNTVLNFVDLANSGRYDGVTFHRVIDGFMAQTGDVENKGGYGGPGYSIPGEFSKDVHHRRGVVSMARSSDPDSGGSQFFIMLADASHLDGQYAAFGEVIEGMGVIDSIRKGDGARNGTVDNPDEILSLRVTSAGFAPAADSPGQTTSVSNEEQFDTFALANGDILTGTVQTPSLTLRTSYGSITFNTSQISKITFEGGVSKLDVLVLWNGDTLSGMLEEEALVVTLEAGNRLQLEREMIREVSFAPRPE